ncbi:hypothetical protein QQF64_026611 [Cirrhinus molitorella]|uniref:Chemokine interleukin-8-like domain-containing protein n=1 Tax=Cirrhinus molitorella TaxID=172907 RepID=A0ABR3NA44_9TELE
MQTTTVTLLIIAAVFWCNTEAFSDAAVDCCLTTKDTRIPIQIVASYFHQTTDSGCPIPATVFITKKDKKFSNTDGTLQCTEQHWTDRK